MPIHTSPPTPKLTTPPPPTPSTIIITFPQPSILLVTLNRPKSLNSITRSGHIELDSIWKWYDAEPSLRCAVITGRGRAFCAGADLKEWDGELGIDNNTKEKPRNQQNQQNQQNPPTNFGGISLRQSGKKPIIAAVNGLCHGGGFEMIINCDMVLASRTATFALPEVKLGVVAIAGALPRLVRTVGRQRAMELCLLGGTIGAERAREWGVVNWVGGGEGEEDEDVLKEAIRWAGVVAGNSPDSVIVGKAGVEVGWEGVGVGEGGERIRRGVYSRMENGENMKEGIRAFVEKREARWVDSKL
ncbi:hypothetical protein MMC09_000894 [Bachmanniomyces sp. S44760]|nr:hypothetical protein [Bachmanniomyces sp. S44760]